jgi:hypothetical protein
VHTHRDNQSLAKPWYGPARHVERERPIPPNGSWCPIRDARCSMSPRFGALPMPMWPNRQAAPAPAGGRKRQEEGFRPNVLHDAAIPRRIRGKPGETLRAGRHAAPTMGGSQRMGRGSRDSVRKHRRPGILLVDYTTRQAEKATPQKWITTQTPTPWCHPPPATCDANWDVPEVAGFRPWAVATSSFCLMGQYLGIRYN